MKLDVAISSIPCIKYNIQYTSGNENAWKDMLQHISEKSYITFPESYIDITDCMELQERLAELGMNSLDELIDNYNELKDKLSEIEEIIY